MPRYKIIIEYHGRDFVGWQRQDNGRAVQQAIEEAIRKFSGETVTLFGAGRTDSGVHALGQVAHFDLERDTDADTVAKYYAALKKAQFDIDLRPEQYVHYYKEEFPERFHDMMDLRYFGPGERIVFEPYSQKMYEESREWVTQRDFFPDGDIGDRAYDEARFIAAE